MVRKSNNLDEKLLKVGKKLIILNGASGLSIREVCKIANINLGMFSYHFKNKENFINIILDEIYDKFLTDFIIEESECSLKTLESQLYVMAKFGRDNRHLILILLSDVINGDKVVQKFVRKRFKNHFLIIYKTIKKCQKEKLIDDVPLLLIITQIAGSIGLSSIIPEVLKKLGINKVFSIGLTTASKTILTDKALKQRVNILIKGIKR